MGDGGLLKTQHKLQQNVWKLSTVQPGVLAGLHAGIVVVVVLVEVVDVVVEVVDVVVDVPQTFGVPPPPQVSGSVHVPQFSMSGQVPSLMRPQLAPSAAHVVGVQHVPFGLLPGGALLT